MDKRGLSTVFRYIFVAIVGAIILLFFINLTFKQISLNKKLTSTELEETLQDVFNSFAVSEDADKTIDLGISSIININKRCDLLSPNIAVDDSEVIKHNNIIFSPNLLKGNKLDIWTKTWEYPFKIDNFFFISNRNSKFYLLDPNQNSFARQLVDYDSGVEYIPRRFNVERITSLSQVNAQGYDFVKVVGFDTDLPNIENVKTLEVNFPSDPSGICDESVDDKLCRGMLNFDNNQEERFFVGKAMLYGAIFADSAESYDCSFNLAINKLGNMARMYNQKKDILAGFTTRCNEQYNMISNGLSGLETSNYADMHTWMLTLKEENDDLRSISGCKELF